MNLNRTEITTYLYSQLACQGQLVFNGTPLMICGDLNTNSQFNCDGVRMTDAATVGLFSKLVDQHRKQQLQVFTNKLNQLRSIYFMPYFAP